MSEALRRRLIGKSSLTYTGTKSTGGVEVACQDNVLTISRSDSKPDESSAAKVLIKNVQDVAGNVFNMAHARSLVDGHAHKERASIAKKLDQLEKKLDKLVG